MMNSGAVTPMAGASVNSGESASDGTAVGASVDVTAGTSVGMPLDSSVGAAVGTSVDATLGPYIGMAVAASDGLLSISSTTAASEAALSIAAGAIFMNPTPVRSITSDNPIAFLFLPF